jgi:D-serine deaminase-like pyridoxal phosphate-dependent protein
VTGTAPAVAAVPDPIWDIAPLPPGLDTPCLVVDLDRAEANARRMGAAAAERGVALRPHVKTHKSIALARLQLEAGAAGITVGTLGEAEVFAADGIDDIFVAYPLWAEGSKADRLRSIHARTPLIVGVDSTAGADRLAAAVAGLATPLRVLIEIDSGGHRTGVADAAGAVAVARRARDAGLEVIGVFTHGGHSYQAPGARVAAAADEVGLLGAAADALRAEGFAVERISAGSTPTAVLSASGPVNEVRPGTYLLGDRTQVALDAIPADGIALVVAATVVSSSVAGQFVIDSGAKSLTKDRAPFLAGFGSIPGFPSAVVERLYDYHAAVTIPSGTSAPALGEVVAVIPNHVCPVVDLFDTFVATRAGAIVGTWPVDARGRSG